MRLMGYVELLTNTLVFAEYVKDVSDLLSIKENILTNKDQAITKKDLLDSVKERLDGVDIKSYGKDGHYITSMKGSLDKFYELHSRLNKAYDENSLSELEILAGLYKELNDEFSRLIKGMCTEE